MFSDEIKQRMKYLKNDKNCFESSDDKIELIEKNSEGKAKLEISITNPCIAFKQLDDHKNPYLNYNKCADNIIFEHINDIWILHIIEFKKTVKSKEWNKIKEQFCGAVLNAMSLSGYLGIKIDYSNINLYTGYRNDKVINQRKASPIELKKPIGKSSKIVDVNDWFNGNVNINILNNLNCKHIKIQLDTDTGNGSYKL